MNFWDKQYSAVEGYKYGTRPNAFPMAVAAALRPGGVLLVEAFHPRQLGRSSGGPKEVELLYTLDDVRADFAGALDEESGEELEVRLDEGPGHQGMAAVTRYRGRAR